jgi:hypothetical protein
MNILSGFIEFLKMLCVAIPFLLLIAGIAWVHVVDTYKPVVKLCAIENGHYVPTKGGCRPYSR